MKFSKLVSEEAEILLAFSSFLRLVIQLFSLIDFGRLDEKVLGQLESHLLVTDLSALMPRRRSQLRNTGTCTGIRTIQINIIVIVVVVVA